ncbi:hypothetical protein HRbin27_00086 [bacterium HR27]|nr:hypothetical protein HRbin27_00086 [bacterium HR27]
MVRIRLRSDGRYEVRIRGKSFYFRSGEEARSFLAPGRGSCPGPSLLARPPSRSFPRDQRRLLSRPPGLGSVPGREGTRGPYPVLPDRRPRSLGAGGGRGKEVNGRSRITGRAQDRMLDPARAEKAASRGRLRTERARLLRSSAGQVLADTEWDSEVRGERLSLRNAGKVRVGPAVCSCDRTEVRRRHVGTMTELRRERAAPVERCRCFEPPCEWDRRMSTRSTCTWNTFCETP